jgi:lysophospholipase L1-like esterase
VVSPLSRVLAAAVVGTCVVGLAAPSVAEPSRGAKWVAAWTAPVVGSATGVTGGPSNLTVRNIARVGLSGTKVRIRVSNATGSTPMMIKAAYVAIQKSGAELEPGTSRRITFHGRRGVTLAPNTSYLYSDPVTFPVRALSKLAVSLFVAESAPVSSAATMNTSYQTANGAGDKATDASGVAFTSTTTSTYALTAIDVLTKQAVGAVVGLGSSTFHGTGSTTDGYNRVLDLMGERANREIRTGHQLSVVSAGIGGDTLHAGLSRLNRDVFSQSGVKAVMVYDVNDLATRTAMQIEDDYRLLIKQAHAKHIKVYCPTWPPAAQSLPAYVNGNERNKLNAWILQSRTCDDWVDWDAVLRGGVVTQEYDPAYLYDGIHPNPAGHHALAYNTPLSWFTRR